MNYLEITDDKGNAHIVIDNGDGTFKSFLADPANLEYAAFLKAFDDNSEAE
jgi:hypothetical protein